MVLAYWDAHMDFDASISHWRSGLVSSPLGGGFCRQALLTAAADVLPWGLRTILALHLPEEPWQETVRPIATKTQTSFGFK